MDTTARLPLPVSPPHGLTPRSFQLDTDREMAARHRCRPRSIQVIRTDVVPAKDTLRKHVQQFHVRCSLGMSCGLRPLRPLRSCEPRFVPFLTHTPLPLLCPTEPEHPLPSAPPPPQANVQRHICLQAPPDLLWLSGVLAAARCGWLAVQRAVHSIVWDAWN